MALLILQTLDADYILSLFPDSLNGSLDSALDARLYVFTTELIPF